MKRSKQKYVPAPRTATREESIVIIQTVFGVRKLDICRQARISDSTLYRMLRDPWIQAQIESKRNAKFQVDEWMAGRLERWEKKGKKLQALAKQLPPVRRG